jgi:hypothetical protein
MERKYFHRAKYLYGVTREQVFAMNDEQGGCCKICRVPFRVGRRPDLDHCHATGQVRGLLCTDCNTGLGHFRDDPRHLLAAAIYLVESRGPAALAEAGST